MIVWIASYPRSGNTLLRMMLHRVFELPSYSKYDDQIFLDAADPTYSAVGHQPMGDAWEVFYRAKLKAKGLYLIKTHEAPLDDEPAIYIVRNGLTAVDSYRHYSRAFDHKDYALEDLILGSRGPYLSWGANLDAWNPRRRARTLVLVYRDLVSQPEQCLDQLADFLGRKRRGAWTNDFQALNGANPKFFRRGQVEPDPASFTPEQLELFDLVHGDWLVELGFSRTPASRHRHGRALRAALMSQDILQAHQQALIAATHETAIQATAATARLEEILLKDREIQNLKRICDEREELIKRLSAPRSTRRNGSTAPFSS